MKIIRANTIYTSDQNIIESNLQNKQGVSRPPQSAQLLLIKVYEVSQIYPWSKHLFLYSPRIMVTSIIFSNISNALLPPSTLIHDELMRIIPKLPQKNRIVVEGAGSPPTCMRGSCAVSKQQDTMETCDEWERTTIKQEQSENDSAELGMCGNTSLDDRFFHAHNL